MRTIILLLALAACQPSDIDPTLARSPEPKAPAATPEPEVDPTPVEYTVPSSYYSDVLGRVVYLNTYRRLLLVEDADHAELLAVVTQHMASQGYTLGVHYEMAIEYSGSVQANILAFTGTALSYQGQDPTTFYME